MYLIRESTNESYSESDSYSEISLGEWTKLNLENPDEKLSDREIKMIGDSVAKYHDRTIEPVFQNLDIWNKDDICMFRLDMGAMNMVVVKKEDYYYVVFCSYFGFHRFYLCDQEKGLVELIKDYEEIHKSMVRGFSSVL
jgi:hypothetical protein